MAWSTGSWTPTICLPAAFRTAAEIAANSPSGVRLTKQTLMTNVDAGSLEAALQLENANQVLATRTTDMAEALAAFRERRPAEFLGPVTRQRPR